MEQLHDTYAQALRPPPPGEYLACMSHFLVHLGNASVGIEPMGEGLLECDEGLLGTALACDVLTALAAFRRDMLKGGRQTNLVAYQRIHRQLNYGMLPRTLKLLNDYTLVGLDTLRHKPDHVPSPALPTHSMAVRACVVDILKSFKLDHPLQRTFKNCYIRRNDLIALLEKRLVRKDIRVLSSLLFRPEQLATTWLFLAQVFPPTLRK